MNKEKSRPRVLLDNVVRKAQMSFGVELIDVGRFRLTRVSFQSGRPAACRSVLLNLEDYAAYLSELGWQSGSFLTLSIPRYLVLAKEIRLPTTDPREIMRMMPFEVETHSPWPPGEVIFGYEEIEKDVEGYTQTLLMVVPKTTVEDMLDRLRVMGLVPSRIEISTLSLSRLFWESKDIALFARGPMGMEYSRFREGRPVFTRGISPNENPKRGLVQSIQMDFQRFGKEVDSSEIVVLDQKGFNGQLVEEVSEVNRPTTSFEDHVTGRIDKLELVTAEVAVGFGAALWRGDPLSSSNLLPDSAKSRYQLGRFFKEARMLALATVWLLLLLVGLGYYYFDHVERSALATRTRILELEGDAGDIETKDRLLNLLEGERHRASLPLNIVLEIYRLTPTNIAINQMQFDSRRDLVITGEAPSFNSVFEYVETLESSSLFERVHLIYTNAPRTSAEGQRMFRIAIDCRSP